jgi:hypothetical protein
MWLAWVTAVVVVLLPFILGALFNGRERADSRGRRIDTRWRVPRS